MDDYLVLDPDTGALRAYLNAGRSDDRLEGCLGRPVDEIASGLGPGADVRFADIDGDGVSNRVLFLLCTDKRRNS